MKTKIWVALLALAVTFGLSSIAYSADEETPPTEQGQKVIAYYLHGTARCYTCRLIESYTEEAIRTGFPKEIEDGKLEWKVINMETSENKHFMNDYKLYTKSVVISKLNEGTETNWKNLDRIWSLTRNKANFIAYIQDETRKMLKSESK